MSSSNLNQKYSKQSNSSGVFVIQKGQLNKYRLRPSVLNEHVETAREIQGVVASGNLVGQIFKASHDNINGVALTLESAAGIDFDNFEGYADTAALQAAWIASTARVALLEETIVAPGGSTKAFSAPTTTVADEWVKTVGATDYTGYTAIIEIRQTEAYAQQKIRLFIGDGANTRSVAIVAPVAGEWFRFEAKDTDFSEDGGTTDITAITKVGFRVESAHPGSNIYVDDLVALPQPGSVKLKLFDMGTSIPVDAVTKLGDGTQCTSLGDIGIESNGSVHSYIDIELIGGRREYFVSGFVAGVAREIPGNVLLNIDHYYALLLEYVDTEVNVWGSNTAYETNYYNNGYAFEAVDEATAIAKIGEYNDIQFLIFSTQSVYIKRVTKNYDATPGNESRENIRVEDDNMKIADVLVQGNQALQSVDISFGDRPFFLTKGGKFEVNHNDDFSDSTSQFSMIIGFIYVPPVVNG